MTARLARAAAAILIRCAALVSALPAIAQTRQANPPVWSYSGANGPDHWSDLDPAFAACKTGACVSSHNPDMPQLMSQGHTFVLNTDVLKENPDEQSV